MIDPEQGTVNLQSTLESCKGSLQNILYATIFFLLSTCKAHLRVAVGVSSLQFRIE